jgi:lipoic acid synthetase
LWFLWVKPVPETLDWDEPEKVARSIKIMNIKHAVITNRDDLKDGGSIIGSKLKAKVMNPYDYSRF